MFYLEEIQPKVYCAYFDDSYTMCMAFARFQEYYENESPVFRDQSFSMFDLMEWYAKKHGAGSFTYTRDILGFNLPCSIIGEVAAKGIPDLNKYDHMMFALESLVRAKDPDLDSCYLLGLDRSGNPEDQLHEIAHGLYFTNAKYRKDMDKLVRALPLSKRGVIEECLRDMGYGGNVMVDEIQAYLATGIFPEWKELKLSNNLKAFKSVFDKHYEVGYGKSSEKV